MPTTKQPKTKTVCLEANDLVYGDRAASYGPVAPNFSRTAKMWTGILGKEITPEQVGLCMIAVKISRQCHNPKRDNLVDIAGYAATLEKLDIETSIF